MFARALDWEIAKMQKTLSFLRVSLKNCGASNWEPKKCLKFGHFQKTSYFAMRFKGTPKISFFPKPWSSEFETDDAVELFLILNLKFVTLKHIFRLVPSSMVFCRTKYQQTSFCAPLVQNSGRNCISKVELRRNLSINGKLPGFEFGGCFPEA